MKSSAKNERTKAALGIRGIFFSFYRDGRSHWMVELNDGEQFQVSAPNLATESTVIRVAAEKLAKRGYPVQYPGKAS